MKIQDVIGILNRIAPLSFQESYDNAGLIVGDADTELSGVLVALDSTEKVVDEAIRKGYNLVVAHHPIVFSGLKSLTGKNYIERTIIKAVKNDIAIYAIHTNLDNVSNGVNKKICEKLGLESIKILMPKKDTLQKLVTFVPSPNKTELVEVLSKAGAGAIGNYSKCSFQANGIGTFEPNQKANPHIGERGQFEEVDETRVEMVFYSHLKNKVIHALKTAHPYEEVAYFIQALDNESNEIGAGMIGELPEAMLETDFLAYLKEKMELPLIKHTGLKEKEVKKVAVCGGSGSFLLGKAMAKGADFFITSDYKYHQFFDAESKIVIADIGHYESEKYTIDLLIDLLEKEIKNKVQVEATTVNTNPVSYYY